MRNNESHWSGLISKPCEAALKVAKRYIWRPCPDLGLVDLYDRSVVLATDLGAVKLELRTFCARERLESRA